MSEHERRLPIGPRLPEPPVSELQRREASMRLWQSVRVYLFIAAFLIGGTVMAVGGYMLTRMVLMAGGRTYYDDQRHFKYGSIGAELANGLPYQVFRALPKVFPEHFGIEGDYSHFGFIYENGKPDEKTGKGLPIGFATGQRQGIEVAWFNCAVCHTGVVRKPGAGQAEIVVGMPANTIELERLFLALFDMAVDKRFNLKDLEKAFPEPLGIVDRLLWNWVVIPNTRATLIARRSELLPLLDPSKASEARLRIIKQCTPQLTDAGESNGDGADQRRNCTTVLNIKPQREYPPHRPSSVTHWGPGRVDTFNPYKLINFNVAADCLHEKERFGASDFPSIFHQGPRGDRAMHLHWDGNNASLKERNLSAAIGAGVTEATLNHASLGRIERWLRDLSPPPSPYKPPSEAVARGRDVYMRECADCHGWQSPSGYVFEGKRLGQIEPIEYVGTDSGRLDSYTQLMEKYQKEQLFCASPQHRFRQFKKTNGYANMPLDGLWLRAPYLHNGSVPTLADLLAPEVNRPKAFLRGRDHVTLDGEKGGFVAPSCDPPPAKAADTPGSFCFDTALRGNTNTGHLYGTGLPPEMKRDLLSYLLTF